MTTAVLSLGSLQQHQHFVNLQQHAGLPLQDVNVNLHNLHNLQNLQNLQNKKMVMMLSSAVDMQQQHQQLPPPNGACVIVSPSGYQPNSPPHFTNLDAHMTSAATTGTTTVITPATTVTATATAGNNNTTKAKNNNLNKVKQGAVQKSRPLQPAARGSVLVNNTAASTAAADALRCKRRIQFSGAAGAGAAATGALSFTGHQPASVARRNARERNRVKQVNNGFATLRSHIPASIAAALQKEAAEEEAAAAAAAASTRSSRGKDKDAAKKLSKVETLRMAVEYIRSLQDMLVQAGASVSNENTAPSSIQIKSEPSVTDSPNGFDADYEAALALSHYSSVTQEPQGVPHPLGGHLPVQHPLMAPHPHGSGMSMSPPCSDASTASSPTPSYVSDGSVGASSTGYAPPTFLRLGAGLGTTATPSHPGHMQCRPHSLDAHSPATPPDCGMYEPMSPEDEELLDVISWWQQSS